MTRKVKIARAPPPPTPDQLAGVICRGRLCQYFAISICSSFMISASRLLMDFICWHEHISARHLGPNHLPNFSENWIIETWNTKVKQFTNKLRWSDRIFKSHLMALLSRFAACAPLTWYLWLHVLSRSITRVQRATCTQDLGIWRKGETLKSRLYPGIALSLPRDVNSQDIGLCGRGDGQLHRAQQLQGAAELVRGQQVVTAETGRSGLRLD